MLNNGLVMPSIGFGTAGLGEQTSEAVHTALLAGYFLFDTAQVLLSQSFFALVCCRQHEICCSQSRLSSACVLTTLYLATHDFTVLKLFNLNQAHATQ